MKKFAHFPCRSLFITGILLTLYLYMLTPALAVNGPHRLPNPKGVCANCHFPHGGYAPKMWARLLPEGDQGKFGGVREACFSCHRDLKEFESLTTLGGLGEVFKDVFEINQYEDHVMHGGAEIKPGTYPNAFSLNMVGSLNTKFFPLNPDDQDKQPALTKGNAHGRSDVNYQAEGKGVYCGTCHNPHQDPSGPADTFYITKGGAYLRTKDNQVGVWGIGAENRYQNAKRKDFCNECHGNFHFPDRDCLDCHHPHQGVEMMTGHEIISRKIFRLAVTPSMFKAMPNIPQITDDPQDDSPSTLCYSCHGPIGAKAGWAQNGATTLLGDDSATPREHHPMGTQAVMPQIPRAVGCEPTLMNKRGELSCASCHNAFHQGDRSNNFLRWDFQQDAALFCCVCHPDKDAFHLGDEQRGHHQICESSPVKRLVTEKDPSTGQNVLVEQGCGNCMLCHFIHDGRNLDETIPRGDILTPDLDALMRIPPKNLAWADKWNDQDLFDYEDMCFGCHGISGVVGGAGLPGSLLLPPQSLDPAERTIPGSIRFSHRFACMPMSETTLYNIRVGGKFPLSDGLYYGTLNDYGVSPGLIFCGTCHNVHDNRTNPQSAYLRGTASPYVPMGFCEECHTTLMSSMFIDPLLNHPLGKGPGEMPNLMLPEGSIFRSTTIDPLRGWDNIFVTGLSGEKGGVTFTPLGQDPRLGQVICLTCHSVHAASTTFDGWADYPHSTAEIFSPGNRGNLLVMDNYLDPSGSDMCIRCHPDFSRLVQSPHDFSPGYRPGCKIGQKGVCSACHVPHNAASAVTWNNKPILWARPLSAEEGMFQQVANPSYTLGDTLLCYDCHSRANNDPPLSEYGLYIPQDVAFIDGPGGQFIGYYEIAPPWLQDIPPLGFKTGGHYIKSPSPGGIMTGDKLACSDCHDPHRGSTLLGAKNQAFIKQGLGGKMNQGFYASRNMAYSDADHGPRNNTESRLICVSCHGFSYNQEKEMLPLSVPFKTVNQSWGSLSPITPPTSTVFEHSSLGAYACTDCHNHNRVTVFCIDCHAFPPTTTGNGWSGPGDTDENYPGGAGAHQVHVFNCKYNCLSCHIGCLHDAGGATVVNPRFDRSRVSLDFNPVFGFPRTRGEYPTKMSYPGLPALYNPREQVCFIGCHNPLVADPDEAPNLINPTPSWSLADKTITTPPTYPSSPLPLWIPDPRTDAFYQQLLLAPTVVPQAQPFLVPWPLPAIP